MALYVRSERVGDMARDLARATGETLTEAVEKSIAERLARVAPPREDEAERLRWERAARIVEEAQAASRAYPTSVPTKAELEEMLGLDDY
jgi:hypothetical protein